jgi:hypothetical protein
MPPERQRSEPDGLIRDEFLAALGQFGVSPFQSTAQEALEEAGRE